MRLVKFMMKICNKQVRGIVVMGILDICTLKLLENETIFWDTIVQIGEKFGGQQDILIAIQIFYSFRSSTGYDVLPSWKIAFLGKRRIL